MPNPQTGGPTLVRCPQLLIQYIQACSVKQKSWKYPGPQKMSSETLVMFNGTGNDYTLHLTGGRKCMGLLTAAR
jgi:hypothetical protein